ncbi:MAG: 8-amino-7-oxononanoate synthase [Ectothiorhodospiraceae bacterium]
MPERDAAALQAALAAHRDAGLERVQRSLEPLDAVTARDEDGRCLVVFCSNDYLGLSQHPEVVAAFQRTAGSAGVGSGAAALVSGRRHEHAALEAELAEWLGRDRALLFPSGYMANLGITAAFAGRGDRVLEDRRNHASLLDGGLLSGARLERYHHADMADLERRLGQGSARLVASDAVFSMDGDVPPLPALAETAAGHGAWLLVDDAHGLGVFGPGGRGAVAAAGLDQDQVPLLVGTLGKAFGTAGAFVAGPEDVVAWLVQKARTAIYTTAQPPAVAAASRASLALIRDRPELQERLHARIRRFRAGAADAGLAVGASDSAIQPVVLGAAEPAVAASDALLQQGYLVSAIRPPTVPQGTARLRVTLSAAHSEAQVDGLVAALADAVPASSLAHQ